MRLVEIVNPVRPYVSLAGPVTCEPFWLAFRFRPVRTTTLGGVYTIRDVFDIDVFTKLLAPVPVREPELV